MSEIATAPDPTLTPEQQRELDALDASLAQDQPPITPDITPEQALEQLNSRKIQVVDISEGVEANAGDHADAYVNEKTSQRGVKGIVAKIWRNQVRDYVHLKHKQKGREQIIESGNLYVMQKGTKEEHDQAATAVVGRFVDEHVRDGETQRSLETIERGADLTGKLKEVILKFSDGRLDEASLLEEKTRILNEFGKTVRTEDRKKGLLFADNIVEVARNAKVAHESGVGQDRIEAALSANYGEARMGVQSQAKLNAAEKMVDKLYKTKVGTLVNETTIMTAVTAVMVVGKFGTRKALTAALVFGGLGAGSGVLAGWRESFHVKQDRRTHSREMAEGGGPPMAEAGKRRKSMEATRYDTVSARQLIEDLESSMPTRHTGAEVLNDALAAIMHAKARINMSDEKNIDLIHFSGKTNVERERLELLMAVATARARFKQALTDSSQEVLDEAGIESRDADELYTSRTAAAVELLNNDMSAKDRAFRKLQLKRVAGAFTTGLVTSVVVGGVLQEVEANVVGHLQGVFEGHDDVQTRRTLLTSLVHHWSGGHHEAATPGHNYVNINDAAKVDIPNGYHLVEHDNKWELISGKNDVIDNNVTFDANGNFDQNTQNLLTEKGFNFTEQSNLVTDPDTVTATQVNMTAADYMNAHPEQLTAVNRELWYDNNTPSVYDQNELRLDWGGTNGSGVDANGNYVFDIQHMTPDGSYENGASANAQELLAQGKMAMALSVTEGTQTHVIMVDFNAQGQAIIDKNSFAGQSLFENQNGQATFDGAYAEAGQLGDVAPDGTQSIDMLATVVGEGQPHNVNDTISQVVHHTHEQVTTSLLAPEARAIPIEIPGAIPIVPRSGLESAPADENEEEENGYNNYGYRQERYDTWESERSPRLIENPDAVLNPREELDWYRDEMQARRGQEYIDEIDSNIDQSPELQGLNADTRLIVSMPVAAVQESENIFQALSLYDKQGDDAKSATTVLLNLNWIDDAEQNPEQMAKIQKTISEIERARQAFPDLNIATFTKVWSREWVDNVRNGRIYGEVIKTLYDTAAMAAQRAMANGTLADNQDVLIVTNDADAQGMHAKYLEHYVGAEADHKDSDAFVGLIRWGTREAVDYPGYAVSNAVMQVLNMVTTRAGSNYDVQPATIGPNSAFRTSAYAAVGGCIDSDDQGAGADSELGRKILAARGFQLKNQESRYAPGYVQSRLNGSEKRSSRPVIRHVVGADIDSSADRLLIAYRENKWLAEAWGGFDKGGYQARGSRSTYGKLITPENPSIRFKPIMSRVERQVSDFVTWWYPDRALAEWGLTTLFPAVDGKDAWTLTETRPEGADGKIQYQFQFTDTGASWLRSKMRKDSRGRKYGQRMQDRLTGGDQPILVQPSNE